MQYNCLKLKKSLQKQVKKYGENSGLSCLQITCLAMADGGKLYVGTSDGLFVKKGESFCKFNDVDSVTQLFAFSDTVFACSDTAISTIIDDRCVATSTYDERIAGIARDQAGSVWMMTTRKLYRLQDGEFRFINETEFDVNCISASEPGVVYAAGKDALMILRGKRFEWGNILRGRSRMPDVDFSSIYADAYGHLWCAGKNGLYVFDGRSEWLTPEKVRVFPKTEVTAVAFDGNGVRYIGTDIGLYKYDNNGSQFMGADRYLADKKVTALAVSSDGSHVYVGTEKGLTCISYTEMSLYEKAMFFEEHIRKYNVREGYILGRVYMESCNMDSGTVQITDNDGLWTAKYVASQCLRYAATGDETALRNARESQRAMMKLETLTGIPGFTARAYRRPGEDRYGNGHSEWRKAEDEVGAIEWRGETSSDEMVGHFYSASWYYDLCADETEKQEIAKNISAIVDHMIENDYQLIDATGEPTTWAHWHPDDLNHDDRWTWEKGTNSLELLAFMRVAYHMTGNEKYLNTYNTLIKRHHYAMNCILYKLHDNHACHIDDRLGFYSVQMLLRYETDAQLRKYYLMGLRQHFEDQRIERNPSWNIIFGSLTGAFCDLENAVRTLQEYPLDCINYVTDNSVRKDIELTDAPVAFGGDVQAKDGLPADERSYGRLGSNAFLLKGGNNRSSHAPTDWLLPYWMARYFNMIEE